MNLTIKTIVYGSHEYQLEVALRRDILRKPLGLEFSAQELAREIEQIHLGAFLNDRLVGCLLLVPLGDSIVKMRQVAIARDHQNQGIGGRLVVFAETWAKQNGSREISLHARDTAVPFYLKQGYQVYDEPFIEVGLSHRKMRKSL